MVHGKSAEGKAWVRLTRSEGDGPKRNSRAGRTEHDAQLLRTRDSACIRCRSGGDGVQTGWEEGFCPKRRGRCRWCQSDVQENANARAFPSKRKYADRRWLELRAAKHEIRAGEDGRNDDDTVDTVMSSIRPPIMRDWHSNCRAATSRAPQHQANLLNGWHSAFPAETPHQPLRTAQ